MSFIPHRDKSFIPHRDMSFIPHRDMSFIPHRDMSNVISCKDTILSSIPPNTTPMFEVFTPVEPHLRPTSSLNPNRWRKLLHHYPDSQFPELLAGIATYGARAGYEGPLLRIRGPNHSSVFRISDEISANIQTEVSAGRVLQILSLPQFYVISPLGAVEKRANGTRTGWRRIHDLSFPKGASVNDGIPAYYGTLLYQNPRRRNSINRAPWSSHCPTQTRDTSIPTRLLVISI